MAGQLVALLLALLAASAAVVGATTFEPEFWNQHLNYTVSHASKSALLGDPNAAPSGPPLFPLTGYSVTMQCKAPNQAFTPAREHDRAGACGYDAASGDYWEKQPGDRMRLSNCYCYALDKFVGSWCSPGVGGGKPVIDPAAMTCDSLAKAVIADGARPVKAADARSGAPLAAGGHYIALVFRPQSACGFPHCMPDYHFLRRDETGTWSHKPGEGPATDRDANGAAITDPASAPLEGNYAEFCGYYAVEPAKVKVGTQPVADRVNMGVKRWRDAGLAVDVKPLAYRPEVDAVSPETLMRERLQMQRQRQQGGRRLLMRGVGSVVGAFDEMRG